MQSSHDAINALFKKQPADYIPMHDSPWGETVKKWVTQGMPTNAEGSPVDCADHFGFDMTGCGGWFNWLAKTDANEVLEETDDWKIVRNGNGAVHRWWKHKAGTPEHLEFHMTSRKIWEEEYRPHLLTDYRKRIGKLDHVRKNLKRRREQGKWTFFGSQFIWENLRSSLGDVNMFMALIDDPEWIHDFNRVYTDLLKGCYKILFGEVGTPDGIWVYEDLGYRDRLFCSVPTLADVIFPYYAELVSFFHEYDLPVVFHSCGYQEPMIPLAIEAGFDALNPMEVKAGNDILKYAEKYGDELVFVGGFDARILESGDRDEIQRGVTDLINGMRERGARFVYGSDHSLSSNVDYDDFMFSLKVYQDLR